MSHVRRSAAVNTIRGLIAVSFLMLLLPGLATAAVTGRYVYYGNPLSPFIGLAEVEVWSGGENVVAGHPEMFSQDYLFKLRRWDMRNLVDGKKDPNERHVELGAPGAGGYSDSTLSYCSLQVDLGKAMPIDKIDIYRSRYMTRGHQDLGWRYLLVLDEQRRIVAWEAFHVYQDDRKKRGGIWSIEPKPAEGKPAGRVVPERSRSWLSEAEFLQDFLGKPVADLTGELSSDDRARLKRFESRNSPEAIEQLGEEFFRLVALERPNLAHVRELVQREKYAEALDAFKAPFFETIGEIAGQAAFEYTWAYDPDSRDTMRARDLMNHIYGDKKTLAVTRFTPGLLPPGKFEYPFQMRPLLLTYCGTSDPAILALWQDMTDDWAMGFQDAADKNPDLRNHFVLTGNAVIRNLLDLANAASSNPNFVKQLSGATLARFLMPVAEEIPVSMWRVWRTCVFNHTFNATGGGYQVARLLADLRAGVRLEREFRQQTLRLHTLSQYRDGPMVEIGDEGHFVFGYLTPNRLYGKLCVAQPDWFTPARESYMLTILRQAELAGVRHTSPGGIGSRWEYRRTVRLPTFEGKFNHEPEKLKRGESVPEADICAFLQRYSVMQEGESRAVANTVYGWGQLLGKFSATEVRGLRVNTMADRLQRNPRFVSDWMPYCGNHYFRGGWERDASLLHMMKPPIANSSLGGFNSYIKAYEFLDPTSYRFQDYATALGAVFATEIEGQSPCAHYKRFPSGSKQSAFSRAVEKPQPSRWFTDDRLDFGEAVFEGVYHNIYRYRRQVGNTDKYVLEYEDDPVTVNGVAAARQIFQVRPARLFLHVERVTYATPDETHTNRIPANLILSEPQPDTKKEFSEKQLVIDAKTCTVKTRNPGNPGLTLAWCGQKDMSFKQYSVNGMITKFWPQPDPEEVDPEKDKLFYDAGWGHGFQTLNGEARTTGRGVFASWHAQGSSVLIGALYANAPGDEPIRTLEDISTDASAGVRAQTKKGIVVTLKVGRQIPADLEIGPVSCRGEALLLVEDPKQKTSDVIVLGAEALTVAGETATVASPDMRFELATEKPCELRKIRRPLDPPTVGPSINTFTDSTTVTLTTSSPDAIIRYTTDVPASRMNEFRREAQRVAAGSSTLAESAERLALREDEGADWKVYTGPFSINEDTLVRARTFRKGVDVVPALRCAGTDVSAVSYGFFHRREAKPKVRRFSLGRPKAGLNYEYLEGRWFALWSYADVLPAKKTGDGAELLDVSMRETDGPFGVRYRGYIDIPSDGVYVFYGPDEYINKACAPGYDLRVYVDGEEWDLGQTWHGRGMWSVPLEKGLHTFMVTFADARAKDIENQRVDLWGSYPCPRTTWRGVAPTLEVSGPELSRQTIPREWLKH